MEPVSSLPPLAGPTEPAEPWVTRPEWRAAVVVVLGLVAFGALAGVGWWQWSPARGVALALGPHSLIPDETENFMAADGRYAVITGGIGLVAALAAWRWHRVRGPAVAAALAVGSTLGALVTALSGWALGGGVSGATLPTADARIIVTPRLEVRAHGLLLVEPLTALLAYGVLVLWAARDDLGRRSSAAQQIQARGGLDQ